MKKNILAAIAATLLLSLISSDGQAQSLRRKVEAGILFTVINLEEVFEIPGGFGGRFTYNVNDYLALDGELNYFPKHRLRGFSFFDPRGRASSDFGEMQGLAGVKSGIRIERFGLFGKARPGFIRFTDKQMVNSSLDNQNKARF